MKRLGLLASLLLAAACAGPAEPIWAPDSEIQKYSHRHGGQTELRLYTMLSAQNGSGMHSALLINAPNERIIFNPAGTFSLPFTPERNDVHHGIDENALKVFIDYHARETIDVVEQRIAVTPEQAALVASLVKSYGAVPKAQCSLSITRILKQVPGFESIGVTYFPKRTQRMFGALPGVSTRIITDDDADQNHNVLFQAVEAYNAN